MKSQVIHQASHLMRLILSTTKSIGKQKVFCIGRNKTGTTSMARAFIQLGYPVGEQALAERLLVDWSRRDFRLLFRYCRSARAFQDTPFSLPFTYQALDQKFPGSKFILTIRDSPEQWYHSLISYYSLVFAGGRQPVLADLQSATYVRPGWLYEANRLINSTAPDDPFNQEMLIAGYNAHNAAVEEYFRHRPADLLVLNVAAQGAYQSLCRFLGEPCLDQEFPWENRTADLKDVAG